MYFQLSIFGRGRAIFVFLGLFLLSAGGLLIASASQTTVITADRALAEYWRTTYDILVRPAGARSAIEEEYGLVEANHLSGIWGGITFEQYELIRGLPGVETAAPIAMIGYFSGGIWTNEITFPPEPGVYLVEQTVTVDDGVHKYAYTSTDFPQRTFYYFDHFPRETSENASGEDSGDENTILNHPSATTSGRVSFPFLVAGIDPLQEAALVDLDKAVIGGRYLESDESLVSTLTRLVESDDYPENEIMVPLLINTTNYQTLMHTAVLIKLDLPPDISTWEQIAEMGGAAYLDSLPGEVVATVETEGEALYQFLLETIAPQFFDDEWQFGPSVGLGSHVTIGSPSALTYIELQHDLDYEGMVLELVIPESQTNTHWTSYRSTGDIMRMEALGWWDPKGLLDIEGIPRPADVHSVPLETYFPPAAMLRFDEQGEPIDPAIPLRPTLNPAGYIQSPPLLITTLEAARALRGESAISAIRVRVGGIDDLSEVSQGKIEAIAVEIAKQTGLTVDIMVGSSPTRLLVHIPGEGYVEEQWIQMGVNLNYQHGMQTGNWLLLATLVISGCIYILDITWAEVTARRPMIALQKALGWRSTTVFTQIMGQMAAISVCAVALGSLAAIGLNQAMGWQGLPQSLMLGLPLVVLALSLMGSVGPAWMASAAAPIRDLRGAAIRGSGKRFGEVKNQWQYAWKEILRTPIRTLLTAFTSTLSAGLLVFLLAVSGERGSMLSGTLLGEFILVRIEGVHFAIIAIGFGLAAFSTLNGLLGSILSRRSEIGVLKAVGWRTAAVTRTFVYEGVLLGLLGGITGAILGGMLYSGYAQLSLSLTVPILIGAGVPGVVGALAAIVPAMIAAKVPAAEAIK